jgi:hypothetical protein
VPNLWQADLAVRLKLLAALSNNGGRASDLIARVILGDRSLV